MLSDPRFRQAVAAFALWVTNGRGGDGVRGRDHVDMQVAVKNMRLRAAYVAAMRAD